MVTELEEIASEEEKYLGRRLDVLKEKFKEPEMNISPFNVKVELLACPNYDKWVQIAYEIGIMTWEQTGIEVASANIDKRRGLAEALMKDRPISAILESAIFVIKIINVSRTMTHQIVRSRNMAFSQQSFRVSSCYTDAVRYPDKLDKKQIEQFDKTAGICRQLYKNMILNGVPMEQARNIMPMGLTTKIIMVCNLSALKKYLESRSSVITQDEHKRLVELIRIELRSKCPEFYKMIGE